MNDQRPNLDDDGPRGGAILWAFIVLGIPFIAGFGLLLVNEIRKRPELFFG